MPISLLLLDNVCSEIRNGGAPGGVAGFGFARVVSVKDNKHFASVQVDGAKAVGHRIFRRDRLDEADAFLPVVAAVGRVVDIAGTAFGFVNRTAEYQRQAGGREL